MFFFVGGADVGVDWQSATTAKAVVKSHFQSVRELGDIVNVTVQMIKDAVADNPHIDKILLVAGFPCQDLSDADPSASS